MSRFDEHQDFCPWHNDQRDSDCRCAASREDRVRRASDAAFGFIDEARDREADRCIAASFGEPITAGLMSTGMRIPTAVRPAPQATMRIAPPEPAAQSRADSFMEALTNIAIGLVISTIANAIVLPAILGVHATVGQNVAIGVIFTVISLVRSYALRRAFNGRSAWVALKGRFA